MTCSWFGRALTKLQMQEILNRYFYDYDDDRFVHMTSCTDLLFVILTLYRCLVNTMILTKVVMTTLPNPRLLIVYI